MKITAVLLMCGLLVGCGNSNNVEIISTGISFGKLEVISLKDSHIISSAEVNNTKTQFGAAELGLGVEEVLIKISGDDGVVMSAVVENGTELKSININALTTLAACRNNYESNVERQNDLISKQFGLSKLQGFEPDMDFKTMNEFNNSTAYGMLLGAFDQLAANLQTNVPELMHDLCDDVAFDGRFNGTGSKGVIQHPLYDEQVLKSKYAQALYTFGHNKIVHVNQMPLEAFANEVSLSQVQDLFTPSIVNYSFDQ